MGEIVDLDRYRKQRKRRASKSKAARSGRARKHDASKAKDTASVIGPIEMDAADTDAAAETGPGNQRDNKKAD